MARNHSHQGKRKKSRSRKPKPVVAKMARGADKHRLYEESVQEVESDVQMIDRVFKRRYERIPRTLREDFCGTAALCCEWVRCRDDNRATGVDIEPQVLEYCRQHHFPKLDSEQQGRVELRMADVLEDETTGIDVTCAFNFSYFCFQTRPILLRYFHDLAPREIARREEIPVVTVKSRLRKGLALLRQKLIQHFEDDRTACGVALLSLGIENWKSAVLPSAILTGGFLVSRSRPRHLGRPRHLRGT